MSIGRNIKSLRLNYGLSQKDLAIIAGVTDKTVSAWENDRIDPRMGAIQKIADHFGIKKSDIIESSKNNNNYLSAQANDDELKLLVKYRKLNKLNKQQISNMISAFLVQQAAM